jgi:hypothetical protein
MRKDRGFGLISWIIIIFLALVLLKFFLNWDVFDAAESDQGQSTILYARDLVNIIWNYIGKPVAFIWNRIFWPILRFAWANFQNLIEMGRGVELPPISTPN